MELLCLGDSLTFGYGVRPSQRWTTLAAAESGWKIVNHGLSGDTTGGMLVRLQCRILSAEVPGACLAGGTVVMLMGGCNDIFYSGTDQSARANMGAMAQQLLASGLTPLIGVPMNIGNSGFPPQWGTLVDFPSVKGGLAAYYDWLTTYAAAFRLPTVDFRSDFLLPDGSADDSLYLDGLHPNAEGHRLMARRLTETLRKIERNLV